ncbi:SDR family NAD(P)-dependent oxidoreductase [Ilumatobacter sp.]|uniref:SDR family NAD(P)-dependent oxidoreductase n=1 Tax=Ilumatobacter sp. TaxID=1967498 RepID=UPI003AF59991
MTGRLDGKVCVVVGAGQQPGPTIGNGRATSMRFAQEGARLLLVDRVGDAVERTRNDVTAANTTTEVATLTVDITADDAPDTIMRTAIETYGRLDVLHNNVGIGAGDAPPHRLADDVFDRIIDVNLRSLWRCCRAAIPQMREQGAGVITNISSIASVAANHIAAYRMSKAGVDALTRNLAVTNAKHGIRVNAILPGLIDTPLGVDSAAAALGIDREVLAERRAATVPMGHQGTAWDVANAALFLASDEAAFVTGVCLPVDGGQSARVG